MNNNPLNQLQDAMKQAALENKLQQLTDELTKINARLEEIEAHLKKQDDPDDKTYIK